MSENFQYNKDAYGSFQWGKKKVAISIKNKAKWVRIIKERGMDKCSKCGYDRCFAAIEFHHNEPGEKKIDISSLMAYISTEEALRELDKCIPLCANCHRELHAERGKHLENSEVKVNHERFLLELYNEIYLREDLS